MFSFLYLILLSLVLFRTCACVDNDLFSNSDDWLFFNPDDDDFRTSVFPVLESSLDISDETLYIEDDPLLLSSCADDIQQSSKLRARENGDSCSSNPIPPPAVPELPNVMNSVQYKNIGDVVGQIALKTPEEICALFVRLPESIIPVCGSPQFGKVSGIGHGGFYYAVYESTLGKLICFISFHTKDFRKTSSSFFSATIKS